MADSDLFIDVVIIAMYVLLAVAAALCVWSAWNGVRTHQRRHSTRIAYAVAGGTALLLLLTYLLGSTRPLSSNGQIFNDALWLRLADMFIYSSIILIVACSVIVAIAKFRR